MSNMSLFNKMVDYFKDSIECFFVLCRQKSKRNFDEVTSMEILHLIEILRFETGTICEQVRVSKNDMEVQLKIEKNAKIAKAQMPK